MEAIETQSICCCVCGIMFWITKSYDSELHRSKNSFFCPNGHKQSYVGKTEADKYRELYQEASSKNYGLENACQSLKNSLRSCKGVITKLKSKKDKSKKKKSGDLKPQGKKQKCDMKK